jgi:hypothetical protein
MTKRIQRKPNPPKAKGVVVGIAWYRPEQWAQLREVASDRAQLDDTYAAWKANAQASLQQLADGGVTVEKVDIDVQELCVWCALQRRPVDGAARSEYAAEQVQKRHTADQ